MSGSPRKSRIRSLTVVFVLELRPPELGVAFSGAELATSISYGHDLTLSPPSSFCGVTAHISYARTIILGSSSTKSDPGVVGVGIEDASVFRGSGLGTMKIITRRKCDRESIR